MTVGVRGAGSAPQSDQGTSSVSPGMLATLGLLAAFAPTAIDLYLPAFPEMAADLKAEPSGIQMSLAGFYIGAALGQPVFGPLSDRFGRRGPLLVGLLICVLASAVAASAPNLVVLVAARAAQGFSAAAGMVIARAMVSDLATGNAAAKALSLIMVISGIAPVIAPTLGSLLGHLSNWRGILWGLAIFAAALLLLVLRAVKESHTRERRAQLKADTAPGPGRMSALRSRVFLGNVFVMAFSAAVMFAYVAASPFFYQGMFGMDPVRFGLMFGATAVVSVAINWYSARLIGRFSVRTILVVGVNVMVAAALVFLLLVIAGVGNGWLIASLFVAVSFSGAVMPKAAALALAEVPPRGRHGFCGHGDGSIHGGRGRDPPRQPCGGAHGGPLCHCSRLVGRHHGHRMHCGPSGQDLGRRGAARVMVPGGVSLPKGGPDHVEQAAGHCFGRNRQGALVRMLQRIA